MLIASILFFALHVIGLLWTEDLRWGLHIVHKMWYFLLLLPVLFTLTKRRYIKHYIFSFLLAIFITEVASYLVWFEVVEPFKNATVRNPTPFMSHVSYNPIIAFACYLVLHEIFFNQKLKKIELFAYSFFAISMSFNMFITAGRAGQVMYFVMLSILIFQYFYSQKIKAIVLIIIVCGGLFFTAYETSPTFKYRIESTINAVESYQINKGTSLGQRFTFASNSFEIIKEHPIIGVGTGDFPLEYKKINLKNSPDLPSPSNPHNMYIFCLLYTSPSPRDS